MSENEGQKGFFAEFFAIKGVFSVRSLCVMGMMVAMSVVLDQISIYVTPQFKFLTVSYLPGVMVAMMFGPWAALVYGFVNDTVLFLVNPHGGAYFFGYAISAMVTYFIYACFLYKRRVKVWRVAIARALIIVIVVFGLNYIWGSMLWGAVASEYFSGARLINNIVQFPFHVALTTFVAWNISKINWIQQEKYL